LILLREGFEAILIVGAIIAYLVKSAGDDKERKKKTVRPVYIGSGIGIILSFVLAWLLNLLKLANTASQEAIEGVTALLAVCVLYYVSNWMLSKSESDAWNTYIKDKTKRASEGGSYFALAFTAFLAVFREGAEVVLFYQPYMGTDNTSSAIAGFVFGAIALVFVYLLINLLSLRIPLKPFFTGTSILMFLMSISFLGAGIKELMEGDIITSITSPDWLQWIPYTDVLDVLGIYPILETLIPQLILLVITIVIFVVTTRKNQKIHAEAEARRAVERAAAEKEKQERTEREFRLHVLRVLQEGIEAEKEGKLQELIKSLEATD
jgi:high-affinity iron transporter